jgi:hypothetical protein
MTDKIRPPWTPQQVAALNGFQRRGGMHPFTCVHEHAGPAPTLVARPDGWHCPGTYTAPCDYRQDWAHAFMAEPTTWPQPLAELRAQAANNAEQSARTTPDNPATSDNAPDNPPRWEPDEALDYGVLPPPAAGPNATLRTGNSLPSASDGPTVHEAADDDRRWDAERAGE